MTCGRFGMDGRTLGVAILAVAAVFTAVPAAASWLNARCQLARAQDELRRAGQNPTADQRLAMSGIHVTLFGSLLTAMVPCALAAIAFLVANTPSQGTAKASPETHLPTAMSYSTSMPYPSVIVQTRVPELVATATVVAQPIATAYVPSGPYPSSTPHVPFGPYPSSTPHPTSTCPPFVQWPTATAVLSLSASRT